MQQRIQCGHRKPDGFSFPGINPHLGHLTRRHFLYRLQYRSRGKGCQPVFQAETRFFYAFYFQNFLKNKNMLRSSISDMNKSSI